MGDLGLTPELERSLGEGNGSPLQYSCLENPMHREAWWAAVHRITESDIPVVTRHARTCCRVDGSVLTWHVHSFLFLPSSPLHRSIFSQKHRSLLQFWSLILTGGRRESFLGCLPFSLRLCSSCLALLSDICSCMWGVPIPAPLKHCHFWIVSVTHWTDLLKFSGFFS